MAQARGGVSPKLQGLHTRGWLDEATHTHTYICLVRWGIRLTSGRGKLGRKVTIPLTSLKAQTPLRLRRLLLLKARPSPLDPVSLRRSYTSAAPTAHLRAAAPTVSAGPTCARFPAARRSTSRGPATAPPHTLAGQGEAQTKAPSRPCSQASARLKGAREAAPPSRDPTRDASASRAGEAS